MKKLILFAFISTLFWTSCEKVEEETATNVSIVVNSPTEGQNYNYGDTIKINARINADADLHGYQIQLLRSSDDSILFNQEAHSHSDNLIFEGGMVNNFNTHTNVKLVVKAYINDALEFKSKTVNIVCH